MSPETKAYDQKMIKTIEVVKANFASVRAGRANAGVLDRIMVEYYGTYSHQSGGRHFLP